MQCAWRNFTRRALGDIGRQWPRGRPFVARPAWRTFSTTQTPSTLPSTHPPLPEQSPPTYTPSVVPVTEHEQPILTPAQLGREASHAVRILLNQRNFADAYIIVNSVRCAGLLDTASSLPEVKNFEHFRSVAIAFTPDVSPRLPSHTLLHGLIRMRMLDEAGNLATQMIQAGMNVRCRSLEALYKATTLGAKQLPPTLSPIPKDPGTRFALRILELARESRQRRSHTMFKTLIKLCLINGEIIVASLLFGTLLRDWQSQQQLDSTAVTVELSPHPAKLNYFVTNICSAIDLHLLSNRTDPDSTLAYAASLQSLANLAHLLDKRLFPSDNVAAILCSMYRCPRGNERVWVPDEGEVEAYSYFHGVMERLIHELPTEVSRTTPPFDLPTTNTLLHYALRHRRSIPLAEKVIENMTQHDRLTLNASTMNILAKAEPLLRKSRLKGLCLKVLDQQRDEKKKHNTTSLLALAVRTEDNYTLSTRISRLVASGKPQLVVDALDIILPELFACHRPHSISDPDLLLRRTICLGPVVFTDILNALQKTGRTGIAEQVWHIAKRAEEMSWDVVRKGDGRGREVVKPWCLPVHAYTIMIKVYAGEAKKARAYFLAHRQGGSKPLSPKLVRIVGWGRDPGNKDGRKVKTDEKPRHYLGRQLAIKVYRAMADVPEEVERRMRELQERQRYEGQRTKLEHFPQVVIAKRHLEVPYPDARFFNAILDVVGRHPHMAPRRPGRSRYARLLRGSLARFAIRRHSHSNHRPRCDPVLPQIAADMTRAGFAVPLVYQRLLVGGVWRDYGWRRYERDRRPWAVAGKQIRMRTAGDVGLVRVPH